MTDNQQLREVVAGLRAPEGPVWCEDGRVLVVEQEAGRISACQDGVRRTIAECGGGPNGAALGPDGALYVCNNGGSAFTEVRSRGWLIPGNQKVGYQGGSIQRVDVATGSVIDLYRFCDGHLLRGPNDIVFDSSGGFWFTDFGKTRTRDRDWGGLYYAQSDGSAITEVVFPLDSPNGVGLSPDGRRLYVAETYVGRIWAWDVVASGVLRTNPVRPAHGADLLIGLGGYQLFDSLAVDCAGNVCVGTLGEHPGLTIIADEGGSYSHIPLPDPAPTNICFGGPDLKVAFITLSASGRLVSMPWPRPGAPLAF